MSNKLRNKRWLVVDTETSALLSGSLQYISNPIFYSYFEIQPLPFSSRCQSITSNGYSLEDLRLTVRQVSGNAIHSAPIEQIYAGQQIYINSFTTFNLRNIRL